MTRESLCQWPTRLAVLLAAWIVCSTAVVAAERGVRVVTEDTAILDLDLPDGAEVSISGQQYGQRRRFEFRPLTEGQIYEQTISVRFASGAQLQRKVLLRGGWDIRLPLSESPPVRPELVLQTGHAGPAWAAEFTSDGKYAVTGSVDSKAVLWDVAGARQLRSFLGHGGAVSSVALSPDGKRLVTGSHDGTAAIWDVVTGQRLHLLREPLGVEVSAAVKMPVWAVDFSPDGRHVLSTGLLDALLWDAATGKLLVRYHEDGQQPKSLTFSPDGSRVLTGSYGADAPEAIEWDTRSGRKLRSLAGHSNAVSAVGYSRDGSHMLTASWDNTARVWDAQTGRQLHVLKGHTAQIWAAAFSPDGSQIVTASPLDKTVIVWATDSGRQLKSFSPEGRFPGDGGAWSVAFSRDGKQALLGVGSTTAEIWDPKTWEPVRRLEGYGVLAKPVAFSAEQRRLVSGHAVWGLGWDLDRGQPEVFGPNALNLANLASGQWSHNARWLLLVGRDGSSELFDVFSGKRRQVFRGYATAPTLFDCSDDGRWALAGSMEESQPALWDAADGSQHPLGNQPKALTSLAVSPDGRLGVTASGDMTADVWDLSTRRRLRTLKQQDEFLNSLAFSPDGKQLLSGGAYGTVALWDVATASQRRTFEGAEALVLSVAMSPDGRLIAAGLTDNRVMVWRAAGGALVHTLEGHSSSVVSVSIGGDSRYLVSGSLDGTARIWDLATGEEIGQLIGLVPGGADLSGAPVVPVHGSDADWLVITPEGLFDGSARGRQLVSYRVGDGLNVVPVDRFFQDFYRPGLLAALFGGARLQPRADLFKQQPPEVRILSPDDDGTVASPRVTLEVEVVDRGGGVQGPWLMHNGARVLAPGSARRVDDKVLRTFEVDLLGGDNRIEVCAASADGSWEAEPAVRVLRLEQPLEKPVLHLVTVGISRYAQAAYTLRFARRDAEALAELFKHRGGALYEEIEEYPLLDEQATAEAVRRTVKQAAKAARPQDTLLLFLSGHGAMVGQRYYFIPHEFRPTANTPLNDNVRDQGLPVDVLGDFLAMGSALKRMLILDTCASGGAVELFQVASRNPFALRGEIERLSRSQGIYVIAASAASEAATEADALEHGVLTYALLAGLKAVKAGPLERIAVQPSNPNQVVDVLEWFSFASGHVPRLTREFSGLEQSVHMAGRGSSFPVLPLSD